MLARVERHAHLAAFARVSASYRRICWFRMVRNIHLERLGNSNAEHRLSGERWPASACSRAPHSSSSSVQRNDSSSSTYSSTQRYHVVISMVAIIHWNKQLLLKWAWTKRSQLTKSTRTSEKSFPYFSSASSNRLASAADHSSIWSLKMAVLLT